MELLFNFEDMKQGTKALTKLRQAFTRAGAPVASADVNKQVRRSSGQTYREAMITFVDNQTVTFAVKQSGDIFQVKINGAVFPIKNQSDHKKAVAELVTALDKSRAKFQAKLARARVALPKGIRSAAPKLEVQLKAASEELDGKIKIAEDQVAGLKVKLGVVTDSAALDSVSYEKAKTSIFAEATVPDGYGGQKTTLYLALVNGEVVEVHRLGAHQAGISAQSKGEAMKAVKANTRYSGVKRADKAVFDSITSDLDTLPEVGDWIECKADVGNVTNSPWTAQITAIEPGGTTRGYRVSYDDGYFVYEIPEKAFTRKYERDGKSFYVADKIIDEVDPEVAAMDSIEPNGAWHTRTMAAMKSKPVASLLFIIKDAAEAAKAAKSLGNDQSEGRYLDEMHYASMELQRRRKAGTLDSAVALAEAVNAGGVYDDISAAEHIIMAQLETAEGEEAEKLREALDCIKTMRADTGILDDVGGLPLATKGKVMERVIADLEGALDSVENNEPIKQALAILRDKKAA